MRFHVRALSPASLATYAALPIAFRVDRVLEVRGAEGGGVTLAERPVAAPYVKDYDALDGGPGRWTERFDLSPWGLFGAVEGGRLVGGAAVAPPDAGLGGAGAGPDVAVLWDLRVAPDVRGQGVGAALVDAAIHWAARRGLRRLRAETQSINVPACRFYAHLGFVLVGVDARAYPDLPGETQVLWERALPSR